jgi:hypothetical protein
MMPIGVLIVSINSASAAFLPQRELVADSTGQAQDDAALQHPHKGMSKAAKLHTASHTVWRFLISALRWAPSNDQEMTPVVCTCCRFKRMHLRASLQPH